MIIKRISHIVVQFSQNMYDFSEHVCPKNIFPKEEWFPKDFFPKMYFFFEGEKYPLGKLVWEK